LIATIVAMVDSLSQTLQQLGLRGHDLSEVLWQRWWHLLLAIVLASTPLMLCGFSFDLLVDFLLSVILHEGLSNGVWCGLSSGGSTPSTIHGWDRCLRCMSASTASRTTASTCYGSNFLLSSLLKACDQTVGSPDRHSSVQLQVVVN
jgi:hypothetical protein